MPALADILSAAEGDEILFDRHDVAGQLDKTLSPRLDLPSGAWLMIETTEAMTTIDAQFGAVPKTMRWPSICKPPSPLPNKFACAH